MKKIKNRYQAMKTRLAKDWWTATFGDPISWLILSFIGDWKWVTPSRITILSFFVIFLSISVYGNVQKTL